MLSFWQDLSTAEQLLWALALPATFAFLTQIGMAFLGSDMDGPSDADVDVDAQDGWQLLNLRTLVHFLLAFSWGGILLGAMMPTWAALLLAAGIALPFSWGLQRLIGRLLRMEESGNLQLEQAVGRMATVYLNIPADQKGRGKVHLALQGGMRELDAVTDGPALPFKTEVLVVEVLPDGLLLVAKA